MKAKPKDSCKEIFSKQGMLTLYCQLIFSILMFVIKPKDLFTINMELHKVNTRQKSDLHVPLVSYQHLHRMVSLLSSRRHYFLQVNHTIFIDGNKVGCHIICSKE
jgi:hypothetical protein